MHEKLVEILEQLGIDLGFMQMDEVSDEYIIFYIQEEKDVNYSDDKSNDISYLITIKYYYKSLKNINKYKKIKKLLVENNFIFKNANDVLSELHYGKLMKFYYRGDSNE